MVGRIYCIVTLIAVSIGFAILPAGAQSGRVFYIDYASGSNSNAGTSKGAPWKSHPYMQTGGGCTGGSGPAYTHQAGDHFIFKGGASWPAACFGMTITAGGTSAAQDYYGVDLTWYSGGSFTRPKFDLGGSVVSTAYGYAVITVPPNGPKYITVDNIEIANQGIGGLGGSNNFRNQCAIGFGSQGSLGDDYDAGTIVENVYIHGMSTSVPTWTKPYAALGYCAGGIDGVELVDHVEIDGDDSSNAGIKPTTSNWYFFAGGVLEAREIRFSKIHGTINGCDQIPLRSSVTYSCHDNELYHISNAGEDSSGVHSHVVFDNQTGADVPSQATYNNAIHDNNAGLNIRLNQQAVAYNNVLWNNINNVPIYIQCYKRFTDGSPCSASDTTYIFNNTMVPNGGTCLNSMGTMGTVYLQNNICIGGGGLGSIVAGATHSSNNRNMGTSEAGTYGLTAANKYNPSQSDPSMAGAGANLGTMCSGQLTSLCQDASGAPWFGGSYAERPTDVGWDMGAYQAGGQSASSRPNPPSNLTATVQ